MPTICANSISEAWAKSRVRLRSRSWTGGYLIDG